jgi:hypothetical protein
MQSAIIRMLITLGQARQKNMHKKDAGIHSKNDCGLTGNASAKLRLNTENRPHFGFIRESQDSQRR